VGVSIDSSSKLRQRDLLTIISCSLTTSVSLVCIEFDYTQVIYKNFFLTQNVEVWKRKDR